MIYETQNAWRIQLGQFKNICEFVSSCDFLFCFKISMKQMAI